MKIEAVTSEVHALALARPYTIAFRRIEAVELVVVRIVCEDGTVGFGAASPEPHVTGETNERCQAASDQSAHGWLIGADVATLPALLRELESKTPDTPAARAALDIALHDLFAKRLSLPLVDVLGRAHDALPTSVTIGILPVDGTVGEAREHADAGFRVLKIKLGHSLDEDIARLHAVRSELGSGMAIRVDPNQGYSKDELLRFLSETSELGIEFVEQPMKASAVDEMRAFPEDLKPQLMLDESLLNSRDALNLVHPPAACGIFNIKLMKCGGIRDSLRIASIAELAGLELMWGCMDESAISIAGALHAAFASPATRYLDLDGSFDLARDVVSGGFVLKDGIMSTVDAPGLGVRWHG